MSRITPLTGRLLTSLAICATSSLAIDPAAAKSLYLIADINESPTPIQTYDIQPGPAYVVLQAEQGVPSLAGGAVGIGIDTESAKLFITYEVSNTIQLVDAINFADLGTTTAPGASNLAGIVVDQGKKKVYTVDRNTNHLYVYAWTAETNTLTLEGGAFVSLPEVTSAHGLALDELRGRLYVGDNTSTTVRYFNTSDWTLAGSFELGEAAQTPMGIAVDTKRNLIFMGNAYHYYGSHGQLVKYDLNTETVSTYSLLSDDGETANNALGVAVDETTGNVYVTTGDQGYGGSDTLLVFDQNLNLLKSDLGDLGDPTGLVIPRENVSFNPLNFSLSADAAIPSGGNLTYRLCYDNVPNTVGAEEVTITDALPAGTSFVSATGPYTVGEATVVWTIGSVAAGAPQACHELVVNVEAPAGAEILNSATIRGTVGAISAPTTQSVVTEVTQALQPLTLTFDDNTPTVERGTQLTFNVCYANTQNDVAIAGVLIEVIPSAGTTYVSSTGGAVFNGEVVAWNVGEVAARAPEQCNALVLQVTAAAGAAVGGAVQLTAEGLPAMTAAHSTEVVSAEPPPPPPPPPPTPQAVVVDGTGKGGGGAFGWMEGLLMLWLAGLARGRKALQLLGGAVLLAFAVGAQAQEPPAGWYMSTDAGRVQVDASAAQLRQQLERRGFAVQQTTMDDTDDGWGMFVGYRFNPYLGLEGGYVDLGEVTSVVHAEVFDPAAFAAAVAAVHPFSIEGYVATGVMSAPIGKLSLFAKAGWVRWEAEADAQVRGGPWAQVRDDGVDVVYGVGLTYGFSTRWSLRAQWQQFDVPRNDLEWTSCALVYRF